MSDEPKLYDLNADPDESQDLAARHPDIVKRLAAKVEVWGTTLSKEYLKSKDKND